MAGLADRAGTVTLDGAALAALLRGPDGPVMRRLLVDGETVKMEARRRVGVGTVPRGGQARPRRPGTLRDSIVKRIAQDAAGPIVQVGSTDPIARLHHEGTPAHEIRPRRAVALVFWSDRAGRTVYARKVRHPGTRPNPYLTGALAVLRGRY